jgi:hypothetical protein
MVLRCAKQPSPAIQFGDLEVSMCGMPVNSSITTVLKEMNIHGGLNIVTP